MRTVTRRDFHKCLLSAGPLAGTLACGTSVTTRAELEASASAALRNHIEGMLVGSLIGDAAGGPVEFRDPSEVEAWMLATRTWPDDRRLNDHEIGELATSFSLLPYDQLRPGADAYGQWQPSAPAGTVTDDSRQKMILLNALSKARDADAFPISEKQFAAEYLAYKDSAPIRRRPQYAALCEESLREYCKAARWVMGGRDTETALPPSRLWGGVPTNAGQMALLPLAAVYAGEPADAYRAAYALAFIDNGTAKDMNAAMVAGLSAALTVPTDLRDPQRAWRSVISVMKTTDPFRYGEIPWVGRPLIQWFDFAKSAAERADGQPKRLFEILERDAKPHYWWDAHFVIVSVFSLLELCRFDGLAALHLTLDFGHDTDSAAQLLGAFVGAIHGPDVFPEAMRRQVILRLKEDYDQSLTQWVDLLSALSNRGSYPEIVRLP